MALKGTHLLHIARLGKNVCMPNWRSLSVTSLRSGTVIPFKLSDIGEGIRNVTMKEWFVQPGDRVAQFDNICEVQSDKASVTITSRYDGLIKSLRHKIDDVVLVGDSLLEIELDDDVNVASTNVDEKHEKQQRSPCDVETDNSGGHPTGIEKVLTTPAVRRLAMENNIDLKDVPGTGKDGRVLKEDILLHLRRMSMGGEEKLSSHEKMAPTRKYDKHMWKAMTQSLSIPHFVFSDECNVTELIRYRNQVKDSIKRQGVSLTFMAFFVKAASKALEQMPKLNAWLDEENETVRVLDSHNIGVAMNTPEGLVVPNIKDVQNLNVLSIAKELDRLKDLGKAASIPLEDLTGTTFSLSNIGVVGGTYAKAVIVRPQICIGAFGKIQKVPRFDEKDNLSATDIITMSWSADHRVIDGVTMAQYSNLWKHYIENPALLLL